MGRLIVNPNSCFNTVMNTPVRDNLLDPSIFATLTFSVVFLPAREMQQGGQLAHFEELRFGFTGVVVLGTQMRYSILSAFPRSRPHPSRLTRFLRKKNRP